MTYYLRKSPPPEVKTSAAKLGLPIINLLDTNNYNHFTVGPAEFIWLFKNASLVYTNSFHGVAFSILFKRPFINREIEKDPLGVSMSVRIVSLLKLFRLEDRTKTSAEPLKIDFTGRNEILPLEREKSLNFLSEALGRKPLLKISRGGGLFKFCLIENLSSPLSDSKIIQNRYLTFILSKICLLIFRTYTQFLINGQIKFFGRK